MKILVTGANGYIGSKVVDQLIEMKHIVIATDFANNNINPKAIYICKNIFEENKDYYSFFDRPDVCIHLAWRDGFVHNSEKHLTDLSNHYAFLSNLIDNGLKHLVVMGTMHEIGFYEGKVDENTPTNPLSLYGISKNCLRLSLQIKAKDITFQWLRAYYIFGDDLFGNSIFCKLRQANAKGITTFPFTTGTNKYDFIHINDLAKQIAVSATQDKIVGIINCCSGTPISLANKIEDYIKTNNLNIKLNYGAYPDRPYDSKIIYGDNTKINEIMESSIKK